MDLDDNVRSIFTCLQNFLTEVKINVKLKLEILLISVFIPRNPILACKLMNTPILTQQLFLF